MKNALSLLLAALLTSFCFEVSAQKFLVVDRYTTKRIKLSEGDPIWFRLKGEDQRRIRDVIKELGDSTILLQKKNHAIRLDEIESLYFDRKFLKNFAPKMGYVGGGFLFSSLVHPLISGARYDQKESAIIGGSMIAASQAVKLFDRKRYKINKNTRIRILDLSFRNAKPTDSGQ